MAFGRKPRQGKSARQLRREAELLTARCDLQAAKLRAAELRTARKGDAVRREILSTYSAAHKRRTDADWRPGSKSAEGAINPDLATMMARARQAVRDSWDAKSGRLAYVRGIVGIGITPRPAAQNPKTGERLKDFNAAAMKLYRRWARNPRLVDVEKKRTMLGVQRHVAGELFEVGEAFILPVYEKRADGLGLSLQLLEPEQLDTTKTSEGGNEIHAGVEVDTYGAPVAYHFYTTVHPLDTYTKQSTRVPAERIIHVFDPARVRASRGVTMMHAVMRRMRHLGMYDEYEVIAKRMEAAVGGVIQHGPTGEGYRTGLAGAAGDTEKDANENDQWNMEPGSLLRLREGEEFQLVNPTRPGQVYGPFTGQQINQNAAGMGLDAATVARDYTKGNFSAQRQGLIVGWDETDPLQMMMIDLMLRSIYEQLITYSVLEGRLEAPRFFRERDWQEAYLEANWQGPPKRWIDPAKQAAAAKIQLDTGLASHEQILNEQGLDVREVFAQIAEAKRIADEMGLTINGLNAPAKTSPVEPRPGRKPPGEGDDEDPGAEGKTEDDGTEAQGAGGNGERLSDRLVEVILEDSLAE